jgi:hypothetical protein
MIFFLRVSVKNRNPYLKTSARRCCAGAFNSGVKGLITGMVMSNRHLYKIILTSAEFLRFDSVP